MPASSVGRLPAFPRERRSQCIVQPGCVAWCEANGLNSAHDFLSLPGVVVSGHVGRNVSRVHIGAQTAFLKREHRVRTRDRLRSWMDGFGWVSVSAREAAVLCRLADRGLPGANWIARGEADGEAFLLVEAAEGAVELRTLGAVSDEVARRIGETIAGLHAAGIDQPDLFAKHILVRPETGALTILDWQRAVLRHRVPWASRVRALASLRATAGNDVLPTGTWSRLLAAYLSATNVSVSIQEMGRDVERLARRLMRRPGIRSQRLPTGVVAQELVRIGGETVCAVPEVAGQLDDPAAIASLYNRANDGREFLGTGGHLRVGHHRQPFGRWWAALRGKSWRSPELRAARMLFHLERHGVPGPRLLAYGQQVPRFAAAKSFLLAHSPQSRQPGLADRSALLELLTRLHETRVCLADIGPGLEPFGMNGAAAVVTDPYRLRLTRRLPARRARRDFARLDAMLGAGDE